MFLFRIVLYCIVSYPIIRIAIILTSKNEFILVDRNLSNRHEFNFSFIFTIRFGVQHPLLLSDDVAASRSRVAMLFQQSGPVPNGVVQLLGRPQNVPPSSQSAQFSFTLPPRRLEAFEEDLSIGGREGIDLRVGADLGRILMDETDSIVSAAMAHGGRLDPGVPGSGRGVYSSAGPEGRHSFYDPRAHPHNRPSSTTVSNEVPVAVELLQRHLRDLLVQRLTVTEEMPQSLSPPHTSPLPPSNPVIEDSEGVADNTPGPLSLSDRDTSLTVPSEGNQTETIMGTEAVAAAAVAVVDTPAADEEPLYEYLMNLMDQLALPSVPPDDTRRLFSIPVPEPGTVPEPLAVTAVSPPPAPIVPTADRSDLALLETPVITAQPDTLVPSTVNSSLDLLTLDLTLIIDTIRETGNTGTDTASITADLGSSSLSIPSHDRIPDSYNDTENLESSGGEGLSSSEGHGIPLSYPSSSTVHREFLLPTTDDVINTASPRSAGVSPSQGAGPISEDPGVPAHTLDPQREGGVDIEGQLQLQPAVGGSSEGGVAVVEGAEESGGGGGGARAIACPAGYEPDVFYSLPEFMQQEVADQHQEVGGSDQTRALVEVRTQYKTRT